VGTSNVREGGFLGFGVEIRDGIGSVQLDWLIEQAVIQRGGERTGKAVRAILGRQRIFCATV
jgi:hypothetical protein